MRDSHRFGVAVAERERARAHEQAKRVFTHIAPQALLLFLVFEYCDFDVLGAAIEDFKTLVVDYASLEHIRLPGSGFGGDFHLLHLQIVGYNHTGVGFEGVGPFKFLRLSGALIAAAVREAGVDFLEEFRLVVESLEIDARIGIPRSLAHDGVTLLHIVDCGTAVPLVGGVVGYVAGEVVEEWNLAERRLV